MAIGTMIIPSAAPEADEQLEKITGLLQTSIESCEVGTTWVVIASKWFKAWKAHVGWEGVARTKTSPGRVNTQGLVKDKMVFREADAELKKGLTLGIEINIVLEEAYDLFIQWYGKDTWHQLLRRKVIEIPNEDTTTTKIVELRPPKFEVNICGKDGEPRRKGQSLFISRTTDTLMLMKDAVDIAYTSTENIRYRVWYSSDGDIWRLMGSIAEPVSDLPAKVGDLPSLAKATRPGIMVELQGEGQWLRSDEDMVKTVEEMFGRLDTVDKMGEDEWRAGLVVNEFCDHHDIDEANPSKSKWRESRVFAVDGDTLTIQWRGFPHTLTVDRNSPTIAKPYSQARDWRNQLRTNTKVEIHLDAIALSEGKDPESVAPVYRNGPFYFFYAPGENEWWIGDDVRIRVGYITAECDVGDPLRIEADKWTFYEPSKQIWLAEPEIKITVVTPASHDRWPEKITITGHTGSQKEKMGTWVRTRYILADVQRIDRKQGKLEVVIPVRRNSTSMSKHNVIKGVKLYGDQVCERATHLSVRKRKLDPENIEATSTDNKRGCAGLRNLGNTCYMNSMLQCLNAAPALANHFNTDKYKSELNVKNALGTGGVLAEAYAGLVREMWAGRFSVVSPNDFKDALGRFATQFAGFQQQDSMELFTFLLDNLHEDLNRIQQKPYVEDIEDNGALDSELAGAAWHNYKLRNDSVIVDELMGQFKSHLTCPNPDCRHETRKFEGYMSIPLPLPRMPKTMKITVVFMDVLKPAMKIEVQVTKKQTSRDLANVIAKKMEGGELSSTNLVILEWHGEKFYKTVYSPTIKDSDCQSVDLINENDELIAYQVVAQEAPETNATNGDDSSDDDQYSHVRSRYRPQPMQGISLGDNYKGFLIQVSQAGVKTVGTHHHPYTTHKMLNRPRMLSFPSNVTNKEIHDTIYSWLKPTLLSEISADVIWAKHPSFKEVITETKTNSTNNNNNNNTNNTNNSGESDGSEMTRPSGRAGFDVDDRQDEDSGNDDSNDSATSTTTTTSPLPPSPVPGTHAPDTLDGTSDNGDRTHTDVTECTTGNVDGNGNPTDVTDSGAGAGGGEAEDNVSDNGNDNDNENDNNNDNDVDIVDGDDNNNVDTADVTSNNTNNTDDAMKEDDVNVEELPPQPAPPYSVALSTDGFVREIKYNPSSPIVHLPYDDVPFQKAVDKHKTHYALGLTVIIENNAIDEAKLFPIEENESDGAADDDKHLKLEKCLEAFTAREQLSKMNTWYCSKCKDHVQAFKKMDVWSVPRILTLHLKRFQFESGYMREKIDSLVKFNEYLDMTPYVQGAQKETPMRYRLFAVSNHIGYGISSGHYTAYARHKEKWSLFNDSRVESASVNEICSQEAYVLFYKRCDDDDDDDDKDDDVDDVDDDVVDHNNDDTDVVVVDHNTDEPRDDSVEEPMDEPTSRPPSPDPTTSPPTEPDVEETTTAMNTDTQ